MFACLDPRPGPSKKVGGRAGTTALALSGRFKFNQEALDTAPCAVAYFLRHYSCMSLLITTPLGGITLRLRPDAAPTTAAYITKLVQHKLYDGASFYRSDFVIQMGTHGMNRPNPEGDLKVNETKSNKIVSNTRGTAAVAHWDVPDCGNSEFFINLGTNAHLDDAYGGYCVFADIPESDATSFATVDAIAAEIKKAGKVPIQSVTVQ